MFDVAPLIVGFDGSTSATAALAWAGATGIPVIVVRVVERRRSLTDRRDAGLDETTALVLGNHAHTAVESLAGSPWRAELVEAASPAAALTAVARWHAATAIVVGSHGHARGHTVLGTAPHQLLAQADVPVVVIPPRRAGPPDCR
jgi:nucleotide-binding universal stress UspA family protein